ncbi:MAG: AraC family transcriptional regulator [Alcanivoracaceae bacterium]|jgi:AraC-like DNA-binding protein|nr:AraC family transcriptional regulator [Alcanivoracaceae bacterium]
MATNGNDTNNAPEFVTGLVVAHFVLAARRMGVDVDAIMARHYIDPENDLQASSRIDGERFDALLIDLIVSSGDPLFGWHVGQQLPPGAYGVLGHIALGCSNLREALVLALKVQELVGNMGWVSMEEEAQGVRVVHHLTHENPVLRNHITQSFMALVVRMVRIATGDEQAAPLWVSFESAAPAAHVVTELETFTGCTLHWERGQNALMAPWSLLDLPIYQMDPGMIEDLERKAVALLQSIKQEQGFADRVRQQLYAVLRRGVPRRAQVAKALGVAERTLDRRLNEENTSWQTLLDQVRAEKATEYLADQGTTVADVAGKLGFSDVRAFQRRFRIWTGMTPSAYRSAQSVAKAGAD